MQENKNSKAIPATQAWLKSVVLDLQLCPFAYAPHRQNRIAYQSSKAQTVEAALLDLEQALQELQAHPEISTSLLIFESGFAHFFDYLDLLDLANLLIDQLNLRGHYQLASFHPKYLFAGEDEQASSHYSNRSPFPMLHLIREAEMELALAHYPQPENIPIRNQALLNEQPPSYWAKKLEDCYLAED